MKTTIYFACTQALTDAELYSRIYEAASKQRREKTDRYRFMKDRMLSLGAEALLKHALMKNGFSPDELHYGYTENGKPYLPEAAGFHFNISHSEEYVMLAVSDTETGCDIEKIAHADMRMAKQILTANEYMHFLDTPESERDRMFFRYWTAKESVMKMLGKGFRMDPSSFAIEFTPLLKAVRADIPPHTLVQSEISGYAYAVCTAKENIQITTEIIHFEEITGGTGNEH